MNLDEFYMSRCLQLASNGLGHTAPNPLVGCVIVKDGHILSEGFHTRHGAYHAEREAILKVSDRHLLYGATLYVNLEPCSHFGLTPPCAQLIVETGISHVVVCNDDPNPLVAGNGYAILRNAGIRVDTHVLEEQGRSLNRRFFTFMEQKRPYVILKWAQTSDGFMDVDRSLNPQQSYWISSSWQTLLSHRLRAHEAAILVGSQTFLNDRPTLSARLFSGRNPIRIVWDRRHRIPSSDLNDSLSRDANNPWLVSDCPDVPSLLTDLFHRNIQSLIVEGGRMILDAFLRSNLFDEAIVMQSSSHFGSGLPAPSFNSHDNRFRIVNPC